MKEQIANNNLDSMKKDGNIAGKPANNPLSKKINKILETRLENDKAALDALKELSTFFPENTLQARRNLRGQIEQRTVAINHDFVSALKEVKDAVDTIYEDVKSIHTQCTEMKAKLNAAKAETKYLTEKTSSLHKQRAILAMQQDVASSFTRVFLLTPEENALLRASPPAVGSAFFAALDRTLQIKTDTRHLLQTGHEGTALEVLASCGEAREAGITHLYQWLLQQARLPDALPAVIPAAMGRLEDRPQLFKLVVDEWVVVRQGALNRQFLHSLTHLSPTHSPIELGAHSPTRYVGDMLAWLHQALASEREVMGALFSACISIDIGTQTNSAVAGIAESVCRPLKTRIEQMIVSDGQIPAVAPPTSASASNGNKQDLLVGNRRPVLLYKMSGLLQFYRDTIFQLTGQGLLVLTLEELQQLSHKLFLVSLQGQVSQCCDQLSPVDVSNSLVPSSGVSTLLSLVSDVITASTLGSGGELDYSAQVVELVVAPLLSTLFATPATDSSETVHNNVYVLNCCHQIHATVALLNTSNSNEKLKQIEVLSDDALQRVKEAQVIAVLGSLGLLAMMPRLEAATATPGSQPPLVNTHECSPPAVYAFVTKLDHFLAQPDAYVLPPIRMLLSSKQRQNILQHTCNMLLQQYAVLHGAVYSPVVGGYSDPDKLVPKTPKMIQSLLVL